VVAGERGDIDDVAGARGDHHGSEGADEQVGRAEVGVDEKVPVLGVDFMERLAGAADGGVVDEDVEALVVAGDLLGEARDRVGIGEVAGQDRGLALVGLDSVADLVEAARIAGDEEDMRAEGGEAERDGFANAASGAGDEGDLRVERGHGFYFRCAGGVTDATFSARVQDRRDFRELRARA
jgi:hypothetical protein